MKEEIDKILEVKIFELVEEYEWISSIVIEKEKIGGIRLCAYLRKLLQV